jgi:histidine triad (HIT) family protein
MNDCLFCKIAKKEIPTDFIFENNTVVAFNDINPVSPFHCLVIPKKHFSSILTIESIIMVDISEAIKEIAKNFKLDLDGFRVITNVGKFGQQTVNHVHFHLVGKRQFSWPPG